jgi:hypothetical protein
MIYVIAHWDYPYSELYFCKSDLSSDSVERIIALTTLTLESYAPEMTIKFPEQENDLLWLAGSYPDKAEYDKSTDLWALSRLELGVEEHVRSFDSNVVVDINLRRYQNMLASIRRRINKIGDSA